MHRSIFTIY